MVEIATPGQDITPVELAQATRNRGMPLEALRYDVTPVGLHYLLIHFDIPTVDAGSWRLDVGGSVRQELELTLTDIRSRPSRTIPVTLECAGNGRARLDPRPMTQPWLDEAVGTATWTGTSLAGVLEEAGVESDTVEIVFTGADHGIEGGEELDYARSLPLTEAMRPEVLLAYEMNGRPLEPQHGFPVRLLVPGWYGMTSVKWLSRVEAVTEPFRGFHQAIAYHYQQSEEDPGEPVTRIRPRALMISPGFPDFPERRRYVDEGLVTIRGRAWSGTAPIVRVEVGVDGGWDDAKLEEPVGEWAWRGWGFDWEAAPGPHVLACRATDARGNTQPLEQPWNHQGMGNNLVQEIAVTVRSRSGGTTP
jgi:DMSO/TMAO reductase YedYZ molybdopterin-dependent catalytic subunit